MGEQILDLNLSSYQKQVTSLTAKLATLEKGTASYSATQRQLNSLTERASSVLSSASSSVSTVTSSMGSLTSSMRTLESQFQSVNNAFSQQQISAAMAEVSNSMSQVQQNATSSFSQVATALNSLGVPVNGVVGLLTNLKATMTSVQVVLAGGVTAVTAFGTALKTLISSNPYLAAIAAILGTIAGAIKLFSSNLKENASHGKQWKRIMATFQPVINLIKNALDQVFDVVLNGMEWLADNLPQALAWIGKNGNWLIQKVIVPVITVIDYIPRKVREAMAFVVKSWSKGWTEVAKTAAKVVKWFGLDDLASTIENFATTANKAINSVMDSYASFDAAAFISKLGNGMESTLSTLSVNMKIAKQMEGERQAIVSAQHDQEYKNLKVEGDIASLRDQAAKTSNKAEKKRLNERAKILEEANAKENEILKERYYNYLKWRNAQSPTSASEAAEEREAKNDIQRAKNASIQRQIKLDKAITTNTTTSGVSTAAGKVGTAAAASIKEMKETLNKAAQEIIDNWKIFLLRIKNGIEGVSVEDSVRLDEISVVEQLEKLLPKAFLPFQWNGIWMKKLNNSSLYTGTNFGSSWGTDWEELLTYMTQREISRIKKATGVVYTQNNYVDKVGTILKNFFHSTISKWITIGGQQFRIVSSDAKSKIQNMFSFYTQDMEEIPKELIKLYNKVISTLDSQVIKDTNSAIVDVVLENYKRQSSIVDLQIEAVKTSTIDRIKEIYSLDKKDLQEISDKINEHYSALFDLKPDLAKSVTVYQRAKEDFINISKVASTDSNEYKEMEAAFKTASQNLVKVYTDYFNLYKQELETGDKLVEEYTARGTAKYLQEYYARQLSILKEAKNDADGVEDLISELLNPKYNTALLKTNDIDNMSQLVATAQGDYNSVNYPKKYKATAFSHSGDAEYDKKIAEASDKLVDYQLELEQLISEYANYVDKSASEAVSNEAKQAELRYNIEKTTQEKLNLLAQKNQAKRTKIINQTLQVYSQMASAIGTICSDISSYQQSRIESELEAGKITEEEAQAQFERTKRTAIAGAVISLLGTIPSEIYSIWKDGTGLDLWGKIAMTATTTASTIAAGVLQIQKLRSTTLNSTSADSSSSGVSASMAAAQATPLLDENQDIDKIQQLKVQTEQRVYILEQDIQDSNKKVKIRESNSTF